MTVALDHVFVCCAPGAPEARRLLDLGLTEGPPNTHPGQGTACRRFFFENAYLELLWVSDAGEARGETAARTRLWPRWSERSTGASPFGIIVRPADGVERDPPFASWPYRPPYLPPPLAIDVAEGTPLTEPAFFYIRFARTPEQVSSPPRVQRGRARRITSVEVGLAGNTALSTAAATLAAAGMISFSRTEAPVMTLGFDGTDTSAEIDLRPALPLVLRGTV
jgi:hypothetical protein